MQRMGDLVLTFPLLLWLSRLYPPWQLRVVAEERFFTPLLPLSPPAGYVTWPEAQSGALDGEHYSLIVNLSIREEAAQLAGRLSAERVVGPVRGTDGALRIHGAWQLYRASLVHNNRHNRFHWAELNALDVVPLSVMAETRYDPPRPPEAATARAVGVFVGASEPTKRPTPEYYAALVRELLVRDLRPVLLGGPDDVPVAQAVLALCPHKPLDMTGKLSVQELAAIGSTLCLLITPDTGPMHLAAWTGLRTLNISVGNVSPWETGPYQPEHVVVRSRASCARGCWSCTRGRTLCGDALTPRRVAALAATLAATPDGDKPLAEQWARLDRQDMPGLGLMRTGRGPQGLYSLTPLGPRTRDELAAGIQAGSIAGAFWRCYFLWRLAGLETEKTAARQHWVQLSARHKALAAHVQGSLPGLGRALRLGLFGGGLIVAPFLRPLTGYLDLLLSNADGSPEGQREALAHFEALAELLA
jgi:ADP-heptose:LPS heptosyltransferase